MKQEYQDYIDKITHRQAYGHCYERCMEMKKEFPELIHCKGWYYEAIWNEDREHHWLKTESGEIIDPTAKQFPTNGALTAEYREYKAGDKVRIGCCAYCGEDIMGFPEEGNNPPTVCSETCHKAYVNYLMG